jgi:hypothetical protein
MGMDLVLVAVPGLETRVSYPHSSSRQGPELAILPNTCTPRISSGVGLRAINFEGFISALAAAVYPLVLPAPTKLRCLEHYHARLTGNIEVLWPAATWKWSHQPRE